MSQTILPPADVASLAEALIACPSVTPAQGMVFDCLEGMLAPLGFDVHRFVVGEAPDGPVENLFACRRGPEGSRHVAYAGHLDVVPPGEGWTSAPFAPERRGELLYGRGAVDMKGSIAAFVAAMAHVPADAGTVSLIITGDEEGPATYGTLAIIDHMKAVGEIPDLCLVGEPTSVHRLGDMIKVGRRGSINVWIEVAGVQGHVAYPHLADNPLTKLVALLGELKSHVLDEGTDWFQASNLEITDVACGNPATNVIPPRACARVSIRFNDLHTGASLADWVGEVAARHGATTRAVVSGEAFLTPPGAFSDLVVEAIRAETGVEPEISTSGGTSDARFLKSLCPVIEFGLCNATMHKRDEAVAVADLETLERIFARIVVEGLKKA
jgi:succinyl-diaminopimelate desuccinylase